MQIVGDDHWRIKRTDKFDVHAFLIIIVKTTEYLHISCVLNVIPASAHKHKTHHKFHISLYSRKTFSQH